MGRIYYRRNISHTYDTITICHQHQTITGSSNYTSSISGHTEVAFLLPIKHQRPRWWLLFHRTKLSLTLSNHWHCRIIIWDDSLDSYDEEGQGMSEVTSPLQYGPSLDNAGSGQWSLIYQQYRPVDAMEGRERERVEQYLVYVQMIKAATGR